MGSIGKTTCPSNNTMANERIYQGENQQWYYRVRGNHEVGPFATHSLADAALKRQMKGWRGMAGPKIQWPRSLQPGRLFRRSVSRQS